MTKPTHTYPISLHLEGKSALVVGGGNVATLRVEGLMLAGAVITVVSPKISPEISEHHTEKRLTVIERGVEERDLDGMSLVLACTDDHDVNSRVIDWANSRGILVNSAHSAERNDFSIPSVGRKGDITIAVSTSGSSPSVSAAMRRRFEESIDDADVAAVELLGEMRKRVHAMDLSHERTTVLLKLLGKLDLADTIRQSSVENARKRAIGLIEGQS